MKLAGILTRAARAARVLTRLRRGRLALASVNLLNRCNQACPMCAVHATPAAAPSLEEFSRLCVAARRAGIVALELSGGEPFLRPDLAELIARVDAAGLLFSFNTNGTALHQGGLDALARSRGLLQVAVSLDSLRPDRYALLRGRDLLPSALAGIERLRAAGLGVPLKINVAVSRHNHDEVPALLEFAEARRLFLSVFPVNQGPGAHRSACAAFDSSPEDRERQARVFDELAALRRRGRALWEPSAFYRAAAAHLRGHRGGPCRAGELYVDVRADGSIAPCVELPAVATVQDLEAGRLTELLGGARAAIARCQAECPCCYTCTVNLVETARRPLATAVETAHVLARAALRRSA